MFPSRQHAKHVSETATGADMSGIDDLESGVRRLAGAVSRLESAVEAELSAGGEREARARDELERASVECERSRALVRDMSGRLDAAITRLGAVVEG